MNKELKEPAQILLYEPNYIWKKSIVYEFIKKSVLVKLIPRKGDIMGTIMANQSSLMLMHLSPSDDSIFKVYKRYKDMNLIPHSTFFGYTEDVYSPELLSNIKHSRMHNLIVKGKDPKAFCEQIMEQSDKQGIQINRREYIRIAPGNHDNLRAMIRLGHEKSIVIVSGKIINLSLSGLIFYYQKERRPSILPQRNMLVKNTTIHLDESSTLNMSSIIVNVIENYIALRLIEMGEYEKHSLTMYICSNLENYYLESNLELNLKNNLYPKPVLTDDARQIGVASRTIPAHN